MDVLVILALFLMETGINDRKTGQTMYCTYWTLPLKQLQLDSSLMIFRLYARSLNRPTGTCAYHAPANSPFMYSMPQ